VAQCGGKNLITISQSSSIAVVFMKIYLHEKSFFVKLLILALMGQCPPYPAMLALIRCRVGTAHHWGLDIFSIQDKRVPIALGVIIGVGVGVGIGIEG
jgi:hypothetical protein